MQTSANGLNHVFWNQVTVAKPELVVVAQGQGPTASMHSLLRFVQTAAQALHSTTGNGGEQVGRQGEIERAMQLI